MIPEELELVTKSLLQCFQRGEDRIGKLLAQMPENLLGGIEFWAIRRQVERMHLRGPGELRTVVASRIVKHDSNGARGQFLPKVRQEQLQALPIDCGQQEEDACPGVWFDGGI